MLSATVHARRREKDFSQLKDSTSRKLGNVVLQCLVDIKNIAYQLAPFKTGALRESIYIEGGFYMGHNLFSSEYAIQRAQDIADRHGNSIEFQSPDVSGADRLHGFVVCPVHYAIFQEYGTSKHRAQPFLGPAVEEVRPQFQRMLMGLYSVSEYGQMAGDIFDITKMGLAVESGSSVAEVG